MSNGVIAAACCCGGTCPTSCCDWWACSPTTPKTMKLTGSRVQTRHITDEAGTFVHNLVVDETHWEVTGVVTRSGSTCTQVPPLYTNIYRYSATSLTLSYIRTRRFYSVGNRDTCTTYCFEQCCHSAPNGACTNITGQIQTVPEGPCDGPLCTTIPGVPTYQDNLNACFCWNCEECAEPGCTTWGAKTLANMVWRLQGVETTTYLGSVGAGTCVTPGLPGCSLPDPTGANARYNGLARNTDVITIVCDQGCSGTCVKPLLLFTPAQVTGVRTTDYTMDPCCPYPCDPFPPSCTSTYSTALCMDTFAILGTGNCLDNNSFKTPTTALLGTWVPKDEIGGAGCFTCAPLDATYKDPSVCVDNTKDGSLNYCAHFTEACDDFPSFFEIQPWPNWCEKNITVCSWGWTLS